MSRGAGVDQRGRRLGAPRVDTKLMPGGQQPQSHRPTHGAKTDEANGMESSKLKVQSSKVKFKVEAKFKAAVTPPLLHFPLSTSV